MNFKPRHIYCKRCNIEIMIRGGRGVNKTYCSLCRPIIVKEQNIQYRINAGVKVRNIGQQQVTQN